MNTPQKTKGPIKKYEHRKVGTDSHKSSIVIMGGGVDFRSDYGNPFIVNRDSAIRWAKEILVAYDEAFCNRVPYKPSKGVS